MILELAEIESMSVNKKDFRTNQVKCVTFLREAEYVCDTDLDSR